MDMKLAEFTAKLKREIYDDLEAGRPPRIGRYNDAVLKEGWAKGRPQMGSVTYRPDGLTLEFITRDPQGSAVILAVEIDSPERIVLMPVPSWVIESVWQGEVLGSHHFESHARQHLAAFNNLLEPEANRPLFDKQSPTRRE
jgi:hypothetical protein